MTRRNKILALFLLTPCFAFAQRGSSGPPGGQSQQIGRMPTPEDNIVELVVHVVYPNESPASENLNVRVDSATGGTVSENFTNQEGKAVFGVRVGAYVIKVRGSGINEVATNIVNIESFEKLHHEYVRVIPNTDGGQGLATGIVSVPQLKVPEKARKQFDLAKDELAKGNRDAAIQHFQNAVELYPQFAMAYNNLAALYMQSKDVSSARKALNSALAADPDLAWTNANLARLEMQERKYPEAIAQIEKALAKEPHNPEFLLLMCKAQFLAGKFDEVLIYARKMYATPHQNFELAHILAGHSLEALNRPNEARAEYQTLLKESPAAPEAAEARKSLARLGSAAKKQ